MTDHLTRERRSWNMAQIRSKDTVPEKLVRSALHRMGLRFRLHARNLPGRPDIVLPRWKVAIFVHGCFWHRHPRCNASYHPKSRISFWTEKFKQNVLRDKRNYRELRAHGWRVVIIWECQAYRPDLGRTLKKQFSKR